jgi:hypothetical protein
MDWMLQIRRMIWPLHNLTHSRVILGEDHANRKRVEALSPISRILIAICLISPLLLACSSRAPVLAGTTPLEVDFSGHWEMDHQLSETVEDSAQLQQAMAAIRARQRNGHMDRGWIGLPSFEVIELTDSISQTTLLEIEQDGRRIEVKRGEDFPLSCSFDRAGPEVEEDSLGTEICGWDRHQLVFYFQLPDKLRVTQRLTLGPDGKHLNIATTVKARGGGPAFTLNRAYSKYEPLPDEFDCEQTLTRGKSCRRATPDEPVIITL